jgi:pyrroline-5-carboxylate reductase
MMKLAIIGTGQMGRALVRAFAGVVLSAEDIAVYDVNEESSKSLASEIGCAQITKVTLNRLSDYNAVLLAVKPQVIAEAINNLSTYFQDKAILISIAAGKSLAELGQLTNENYRLVRVMPNTPAMVGSGVSAIAYSNSVDEKIKNWIMQLFSACGLAFEVPEKLMDAVTGLSGSGPAYMMLVMEALADGGVRQGLSRELAIKMAAMTMLGSAKLVLESGQHPAVLKDQVCSPAGTTIEAVAVLEKYGLRSALIEAVAASSAKSAKLGYKEGNAGK